MAIALTKINAFVENLGKKMIDLSGNGLTIALTNTAHEAAWDELADLTQVSYTNLSSRVLSVTSYTQTSGTAKLIVATATVSATGSVGPFRYVYIYDDNSTGDKLIGYYDYGSSITLQDGDSFQVVFDGTEGVLTIA